MSQAQNSQKPKVIALVVAAGSGSRMGKDMPKQYLPLGGKTVLRHCLETFRRHPRISGVRVVINDSLRDLYESAVAGLDLLPPVAGGQRRQDSVRAGLESLAAEAPDLVLIHDAARPFIDAATIDRTIDTLAAHDGALVAVPVVDTLKRGAQDGTDMFSGATVDRNGLWRAQTPQGFRYQPLLAAHRQAASGPEMTDDAAVAEAAGMKVALVLGHENNFKITAPADLERAERLMSEQMEYRTGNGFDVHRLIPGDGVIMCGVTIPYHQKLEGHSDADVGMHALTDAILGAVGAGDIGQHFPPSDPQWRGAASWKFLAHAAKLVADKGGRIAHCDITLICEKPKVGPHRAAMQAKLAEILGIALDRVSVKATTTEQLGFTGRGEGIAAQATATVALPVTA
ncbi:bifunctional 2-C-methyl-D-erythritol 4-phosphate cytidylyltransferase/2-C-methyl-D-erythritol 2,4-cyclodiphosphate synthase [Dongia rigui]|uniref:Bifunctional enzyme IspD/IspF n=1 Tax=Dongia rigui TaxID=940149 RepID=A0ABU5E4Y4_9PROT|nr:bifunctional 2-C-methyl-D-erythritol 4-phosphate cytidylyltransferase/2-C-methyl-D-erythritol 2,4-cyclodiphosphate synthase [Dongia rigui]MDY0874249.1 bifunctional 2-C-methyl-D-erythritol 4-phosphate cytidylyltransferase/2-C-methyl-D-erythritol 2,4-cyclodiphosphate synthase [Dongia rigui]